MKTEGNVTPPAIIEFYVNVHASIVHFPTLQIISLIGKTQETAFPSTKIKFFVSLEFPSFFHTRSPHLFILFPPTQRDICSRRKGEGETFRILDSHEGRKKDKEHYKF